MSDSKYDGLKIHNQLCFPIYAAARETIKLYKPHLDRIGLTYTQYISMMLLWEYKQMTVKEMGEKLYLDSGTLTPLLKKLEAKGLVKRVRSVEDERNLNIIITDEGEALKDEAVGIPAAMSKGITLQPDEIITLYRLIYKLLGRNMDEYIKNVLGADI